MLETIKNLCRDNEYFSHAGDDKFLYGKMLDMIFDRRFSNHDIAVVIWLCSKNKQFEQIEKEISAIRSEPKHII